jgi:hypothetical protein
MLSFGQFYKKYKARFPHKAHVAAPKYRRALMMFGMDGDGRAARMLPSPTEGLVDRVLRQAGVPILEFVGENMLNPIQKDLTDVMRGLVNRLVIDGNKLSRYEPTDEGRRALYRSVGTLQGILSPARARAYAAATSGGAGAGGAGAEEAPTLYKSVTTLIIKNYTNEVHSRTPFETITNAIVEALRENTTVIELHFDKVCTQVARQIIESVLPRVEKVYLHNLVNTRSSLQDILESLIGAPRLHCLHTDLALQHVVRGSSSRRHLTHFSPGVEAALTSILDTRTTSFELDITFVHGSIYYANGPYIRFLRFIGHLRHVNKIGIHGLNFQALVTHLTPHVAGLSDEDQLEVVEIAEEVTNESILTRILRNTDITSLNLDHMVGESYTDPETARGVATTFAGLIRSNETIRELSIDNTFNFSYAGAEPIILNGIKANSHIRNLTLGHIRDTRALESLLRATTTLERVSVFVQSADKSVHTALRGAIRKEGLQLTIRQ